MLRKTKEHLPFRKKEIIVKKEKAEQVQEEMKKEDIFEKKNMVGENVNRHDKVKKAQRAGTPTM